MYRFDMGDGVKIHVRQMKMENQMLALFHKDKYITKPFQILIDQLKNKNKYVLYNIKTEQNE